MQEFFALGDASILTQDAEKLGLDCVKFGLLLRNLDQTLKTADVIICAINANFDINEDIIKYAEDLSVDCVTDFFDFALCRRGGGRIRIARLEVLNRISFSCR